MSAIRLPRDLVQNTQPNILTSLGKLLKSPQHPFLILFSTQEGGIQKLGNLKIYKSPNPLFIFSKRGQPRNQEIQKFWISYFPQILQRTGAAIQKMPVCQTANWWDTQVKPYHPTSMQQIINQLYSSRHTLSSPQRSPLLSQPTTQPPRLFATCLNTPSTSAVRWSNMWPSGVYEGGSFPGEKCWPHLTWLFSVFVMSPFVLPFVPNAHTKEIVSNTFIMFSDISRQKRMPPRRSTVQSRHDEFLSLFLSNLEFQTTNGLFFFFIT